MPPLERVFLSRFLATLAGALLAVSLPTKALANACTSAGGNWGTNGTWTNCGGGIPQNGDSVTITAGTVTVNVATIPAAGSLTSLTMSGGTMSWNGSAGAKTITVSGDVTMNGGAMSVSANNAIHTFNVGGNVVINGTASFDLFNTAARATTLNLTNAAGAQINGNGSAANQFADVVTTGGLTINKTGTTVTQTGSLTVGSAGTHNLSVASGSSLTVANNVDVAGATSVAGTFVHSGTTGTRTFAGTLTVTGTWTNSANEPIFLQNGLVFSGTTFTAGTGAYTFDPGQASQTIGGTAALAIPSISITSGVNLTNDNSGGLTIATSMGAGTGTFTNGAGRTVNIGFAGPPTPTIDATPAGNIVNYNRANVQTVKPTAYANLQLSTSSAKTMTGVTQVTEDLTVQGSATMTGNAAFTVGGTLFYNSTAGTTTLTAASPISVGQFSQGGAGTLAAGANTITVTGTGASTWTRSAGSFTTTGTVIFTGAAPEIGGAAATAFSTLTIGNGTAATAAVLVGSASPTVAGNLLVRTASSGGSTLDLGAFTANRTAAGGTLTLEANATLKIGGTNGFPTNYSTHTLDATSTVEYNGTAQTVLNETGGPGGYGNLTLAGSGAKTMPAATQAVRGNFTMSGSAAATAQGALNVAKNFTIGGSNTFTAGAFTHQIGGDFSLASGATFTSTSSTFAFNGSGAQSIGGTAASITFNNLTTASTSNLTTTVPLAMSGTVTLGAGTTLNAGSFSHTVAGNFTNNGGTLAPSTGTFTFNASGAQAIGGTAGTTFNNVATSNTSSVTVSQPLTINGSLTLGNGTTFAAGASSHSIAGNFTNNTATFSSTGQITLNGASAQTIGGTSASTFYTLVVNSAGVSLSGVNATASNQLTLTNGVVATGANTLILSGNCSATNPARTNGWVAGRLSLRVPTGSPTCNWHIGGATNYRPYSVAFTTVTVAGDIAAIVSQSAGEHPNIGTSTIDSGFDVNRYWTITNAATTFTSAIATFTFVGTDYDAGADPTAFIVGRYASGWTYPGSVAAALNTQATGLTGTTIAGDFAIGEQAISAYSAWRMDQNLWNGTANEVVDSGTGANHGTASTCAFVGCAVSGSAPPKPTTSSTSPALGTSGVSGTCSYGVFNRANKDFVQLSTSYPRLFSAAGGFTVAAWIRTTDNTQSGQRILIDDANGVNGGWGISLGDGGTGRVRIFYRQASGAYILDSTTYVIPNNTWVLVTVSVSLAAGANASRGTIRVYSTSGTLLNTPATDTSTFTWTAASETGNPSIGGETNNAGEGTASFGFAGNIDEVRVYRQALTATQIDRIKLETRACATFNHIRFEHDGIGLTCQPETIVVKACFDASCTQLFNGTATATLLPTGWVGGDAVAISGSLSAQLKKTTAGTYTLGTTGVTTPVPTAAARCFLNGSEFAGSCNIDFKDTGFVVDSFNVTACKPLANVGIRAVRLDQQSQTCAPAWQGSRSLRMWSTYSNPGSGSSQVTVNSTALPTSDPGSNNMTLTFDANAQALVTVSYPDAGQVVLNAGFTGSGSESGVSLTGSQTFVSVPVGLAVVPSGGSCVAGDATCAAYKKAGESFTHTVQAACWTSDSDPDLTDNPLTPNFQMSNIPLTSTLVAPGGGANAALGASTATISTGGTVTVTQTMSEVGVFRVTATPAAAGYFGQTVPGGTSVNIGRFTPDHFDVSYNAPSFGAACTSNTAFTYIGQSFSYTTAPVLTVTARNGSGGTTTNYQGSFFKLTNGSLTGKAYTAAVGTLDTSLVGSPDPAIVDNANGTASLTFNSGTGVAFTRSTPVAPFNAEISLAINVIDGDAIAYGSNPARFGQASAGNGIAFTGGKSMRFGRLRLQGAAGSTLVPLTIPIRTEYWTGTGFTLNTDDGCTALDRQNIALINYRTPLAACQTLVNQDPITFAGGLGTLRLKAPGSGNTGSVTLAPQLGSAASGNYCSASPGSESTATAAGKSYLQGAWTGGSYDQNPSARAGFGVFGAQPRNFIFFRENH